MKLPNKELAPAIFKAIEASLDAGALLMSYFSSNDLNIEQKSDLSPVTIADRSANDLITERLQSTGLPILSEESQLQPFAQRSEWEYFWCVDPLDGTKEFIHNRKDFSVNIALMLRNQPVFGIIYLPAYDQLYFGGADAGAYVVDRCSTLNRLELSRNAVQLPRLNSSIFTIVSSFSHQDVVTASHIQEFVQSKGAENVSILVSGGSVKFCLLAEGRVHYYPRGGNLMEWDLAAGHAICEGIGCWIGDWFGNKLIYNKPDMVMPPFKISRKFE